jgi:hypothetical protein
VLELLPERIRLAAEQYSPINEIRLRTDRPVSFNVGGHNIVTGIITDADELDCIVGLLCGGSLHAHERSIAEGYIDYMGCRVGVCGTRHINSINIRIPRYVRGVGGALLLRLAAADFKYGALINSTTINGFGRPLALFVVGVLLGVTAIGATYLTHGANLAAMKREFAGKEADNNEDKVLAESKKKAAARWSLFRAAINFVVILLVVGSLFCFAYGSVDAYRAFQSGIKYEDTNHGRGHKGSAS